VSLPNGYFKCDVDDIDIVENHLWSSNRKGYVAARINGAKRLFHHVVTNNNRPLHINTEFIDKNPLNCHKSNLRLADKRAINITCNKIILWVLLESIIIITIEAGMQHGKMNKVTNIQNHSQ